jgi:hypothetical protein
LGGTRREPIPSVGNPSKERNEIMASIQTLILRLSLSAVLVAAAAVGAGWKWTY